MVVYSCRPGLALRSLKQGGQELEASHSYLVSLNKHGLLEIPLK